MTGARILLVLLCAAFGTAYSAESDSEGTLFIGVRPPVSAHLPAPAAVTRSWFNGEMSDKAFLDETFAAAKALAYEKATPAERSGLESDLERVKTRAGKVFLELLNWTQCSDPVARVGAVGGLKICGEDSKRLGTALAASAVFDPDERVRKASAALIKSSQDKIAKGALLETWKSSFDESGTLDANETRRKASVAAMREINDKQIFQALLYYATLELHGGTSAPVAVNTVNITGNGVNLPIDLPTLDLINVEGSITVPAMASLKQASGQDFGRNLLKWNEWVSKLP